MPQQFRFELGFVLGMAVCLSAAGCGANRQLVARPKPADDPSVWSGSPISSRSEASESSSDGGSKGFLKSTRLPGAMSSEGAEIERSLGVLR